MSTQTVPVGLLLEELLEELLYCALLDDELEELDGVGVGPFTPKLM